MPELLIEELCLDAAGVPLPVHVDEVAPQPVQHVVEQREHLKERAIRVTIFVKFRNFEREK